MTSNSCLGDIAEIIMGQSPSGDACNDTGEGIPLLNGPTEFGSKHPAPVQFTTDPKKISKQGDLLFCVRGSTTGRMNWADQEYAIGRGLAAIRGKEGIPNSFVRAVIEANLNDLLVQATGSTFPNVSKDLISSLSIPVITPAFAKNIASIVEPLDDSITLLRETNSSLEAITQSIFKSWFVDFDPVQAKAKGKKPEGMNDAISAFFPDGFEETNLGMIPKGWSAGTIADLMRLHKGSVNPALHPDVEFQHFSLPSYDDGMMPVIEQGRLIKSNKTSVPENAVLVSKLNPHIPRVWLPSEVVQNSVCSTEFLPFIPSENSSTTFIYCLLAAPDFLQSLCQLVTGTSNSHQRIKPDGILTMQYVVPSSSAIDAFDSVTKPLIQRVKLNQLKAQSLSTLRDALLPKLISGNLRLTESALEVD